LRQKSAKCFSGRGGEAEKHRRKHAPHNARKTAIGERPPETAKAVEAAAGYLKNFGADQKGNP